jgi:hypothetical protein
MVSGSILAELRVARSTPCPGGSTDLS